MATHWAHDAVFYHAYPLGMCGAPYRNDFADRMEPRLAQLFDWIGHWQSLGVNALYLGPLFASSSHGYDTADYYRVDRRLGDETLLKELIKALHQAGIRVILDGVFNHVGRDFWAFKDVQWRGPASAYTDWIAGLDFGHRSPLGDPFTYRPWRGHYELVKLNLAHRPVREHLLGAVEMWLQEFDIDGLRLDTANIVRAPFLRELARFCKQRKADFVLLGEIVGGDYAKIMHQRSLDAVTNYNAYGGLIGSHNHRNYFETAGTLRWQFGPEGVYRGLPLYNFVDNHDVNRVASRLRLKAHLYPLHILLFTMPGVPSLYYGSEWGISGTRGRGSDLALRPPLRYPDPAGKPHPDLANAIRALSRIRHATPALRHGEYRELFVQGEQFAFERYTADQQVVVVLNAARYRRAVRLWVPHLRGRVLQDLLNPGEGFAVQGEHVVIEPVHPRWGRILLAT